ncbi:MAG: glycoside hydrolase family 75 protein [Alphaproteobacteria bacterium]
MHAKQRLSAFKLVRLAAATALAAVLGSCATEPPGYAWGPIPGSGECGNLLPFFAAGTGPRDMIYGQPSGNALLFVGGIEIDANGAPNAYHPNGISGLDDLSNAGSPGNWWGLATDSWGKPFVQSTTDKYPGFYISKTALTDPEIGDSAETRRYVDASHVPYVELPGGERAREALRKAGMHLGDLVIVYNVRTRKTSGAIWADEGDPHDLGGGSIKLAEKLGYADTNPRTGGTDEPENIYLLFPGTSLGFPRRVGEIERNANDLLAMWGGQTRLDNCAQALNAH